MISCFSYLLLHTSHLRHSGLKQQQSFLCPHFCNLARIQWGQFVAIPIEATQLGLDDPLPKMPCSQGCQVSAGRLPGPPLGLLPEAPGPPLPEAGHEAAWAFAQHGSGVPRASIPRKPPPFASTYQASTCIILANVPLATESSMTKSRVIGGGRVIHKDINTRGHSSCWLSK